MSRRRPLVGVTCYAEEISWAVWRVPGTFVPSGYVETIDVAGGYPVLLPPLDSVAGDPAAVCASLDALVLTGGADVDPAHYGGAAPDDPAQLRPGRDHAELALAHHAVDSGLPLLAVCRGMQVLNVARGGTLIPHLPDVVGSDVHLLTPGQLGRHRVRAAAGSRLAKLLDDAGSGSGEAGWAEVSSHHHQAVDRLGSGVVAVGWAEDGVVEAIELADHPFAVGVQWHPEMTGSALDRALFAALLEAV
ncbi:MAG TPA: gamma-glutamyl-gamma-aminobutyrate hydrolase family protein [Actinomycetes bacterium]|nr:gamma-glutamyl-gamma-aminobutyrate hydrolase family protein [Actinomycetes bacterium]